MKMNGELVQVRCPVSDDWHHVQAAITESKKQKEDVKEDIKDIVRALKSLNRNNTILLLFLGVLLIIKEVRDSGHDFRASAGGASIEMNGERNAR